VTFSHSAREILLHHQVLVPEQPLDGLDNIYDAYGTYLLVPSYTGPLVRIRESAGNTEQDFYPDPRTGFLNPAEIAAFLNGASGFIPTVYGQAGLDDWIETTAGSQIAIDLLHAPFPLLDFRNGRSMGKASGTGLRNFGRNSGGVSIVGVNTAGGGFGACTFWVTNNSGADSRISLQNTNNGGGFPSVVGRRLDADTNETVASLPKVGTSGGHWAVQVARVDWANAMVYHRRGIHQTSAAFQTAGVTSDTVANQVRWGSRSGGQFSGFATALVLFSDVLTETEADNVVRRCRRLIPPAERGVDR